MVKAFDCGPKGPRLESYLLLFAGKAFSSPLLPLGDQPLAERAWGKNISPTPFPKPFSTWVKAIWMADHLNLFYFFRVCSILSTDVRKWRVSTALVSWHTFLFRHPCSQPVSITIIFWLYTFQHGNAWGISLYSLPISSNLTNCSPILPNVYILYEFHPKGHSVVPKLTPSSCSLHLTW